jgi:hypothetical protein
MTKRLEMAPVYLEAVEGIGVAAAGAAMEFTLGNNRFQFSVEAPNSSGPGCVAADGSAAADARMSRYSYARNLR